MSGNNAALVERAIEESGGCCNVWSLLLTPPDQDPPDWFCPPTDVGEATGLCTLAEARYFAVLDPTVWESGELGALLCVEHAARLRRIGGVVRIQSLAAATGAGPAAGTPS